jgi:Flp pilus assembly protein TadD
MRRPLAIFPFAILMAAVGCGDNRQVVHADRINPVNSNLARQENEKAYKLIAEGKYDDAARSLDRAISADVMFGPARNNRGLVYFHQGRLYEAAHEFQYAIKLMPHNPEPRNNLGMVFEAASDHIGSPTKLADALDAYEQARRLEPDNPQYIGNLARAKVKRGDRDPDTQQLLEELVFKDPRPDWREWARAKLLQLRARPPEERAPAPATQPR